MSKSKGNFLSMRDYLDILDADYIRYYLASKLSPSIDDIDLNYDDFQKKVNSDLVGKFVNIASRSVGFLKKNDNQIGTDIDHEFYENFISSKNEASSDSRSARFRAWSICLRYTLDGSEVFVRFASMRVAFETRSAEVNNINCFSPTLITDPTPERGTTSFLFQGFSQS